MIVLEAWKFTKIVEKWRDIYSVKSTTSTSHVKSDCYHECEENSDSIADNSKFSLELCQDKSQSDCTILPFYIAGGEFLLNHIKRPEDGRCYFQVTAEGQPIKIQRTVFTECFYTLAMAELARASNLPKYRV